MYKPKHSYMAFSSISISGQRYKRKTSSILGCLTKCFYLCTTNNRKVAQLVAHYVRDVGVGRSSRLFPTKARLLCLAFLFFIVSTENVSKVQSILCILLYFNFHHSSLNVDAGSPTAFTKLARVKGCQP